MQPVEAKQASEQSSPIDKLVFLLSAIVCLIIWGFTLVFMQRGFDLTDTGYYLLSFLHYEDVEANITLFATILKPLYDLAGTSTSLMRLYGGIIFLSVSFFVSAISVYFFSKERETSFWQNLSYLALFFTASSLHYNLWLSTIPNYNWLNQIALSLVFAGFLTWSSLKNQRLSITGPLLICFAFWLSAWVKISTAIFIPLLVLGFLWLKRKDLKALFSFPHILLGGLGFILGILIIFIQGESPAKIAETLNFAIRLEVAQKPVYDNPISYFLGHLIEAVGYLYPIREYLFSYWYLILTPSLFIIGLGFYTASSQKRQTETIKQILNILLLVAWLINILFALTFPFIQQISTLLLRVYLISLIFSAEAFFVHKLIHRKNTVSKSSQFGNAFVLSLMMLLFTFIFSYGTDTPFVAHTSYASFFYILAIVLLIYYPRLDALNNLRRFSPVILSIFIAYTLYQTSLYPYRQDSSLFEMTEATSIRFGEESILMDTEMANYVTELQRLASSASFEVGTGMIDMTGHSPSTVYLLGGRSHIFPWLTGGSEEKAAFVSRVLAAWQREDLESAWILTVLENPSRETPSSVLVDLGLPFPEGYELVGEIQRPYSDEVQGLWRPIEN